ncbi:MAG: helix-turn-helix domain-containing protein [Synergistales bacterium]|nr:helix-turn-helix domain-containing protein [Synergistales bacterium]
MSFGRRLKTLRKSRGYTQQTLADSVGVSRIYVQALESNRRSPSMKLLRKLGEELKVNMAELLETTEITTDHGRLHLEEIFEDAGEVEVWYKSKRLKPQEIEMVQRLVEAALARWENEDASG